MMPTSTKGVLGHICEPADALAAAAKVRDAGWKHFDFLTPFPIHGMEEAMGQKRSWIPWATGVLAVCGILFAQGLQNYVMVFDWPMNFGGKPHEWAHKCEVLKGHCAAVGRDYDEIVKTWSPEVFIRTDEQEIIDGGTRSFWAAGCGRAGPRSPSSTTTS